VTRRPITSSDAKPSDEKASDATRTVIRLGPSMRTDFQFIDTDLVWLIGCHPRTEVVYTVGLRHTSNSLARERGITPLTWLPVPEPGLCPRVDEHHGESKRRFSTESGSRGIGPTRLVDLWRSAQPSTSSRGCELRSDAIARRAAR
jgi:hypothetical protein